jgi:glutamine amidotransferase
MKPKIVIIDYGAGNLRSIFRGLEHSGAKPEITGNPEDLESADAIVLPGVGAFLDAMKNLEPFRKPILENAGKKPILGVCLGLQLFFTESEEGGLHRGLDLMKGRIVRLPETVKIPQMGWNSLDKRKDTALLEGIKTGDFFYFVHSYYAVPEEDVTSATCEYAVDVPAVVEKDLLFATQFHPEKSGEKGLRILENFVGIVEGV